MTHKILTTEFGRSAPKKIAGCAVSRRAILFTHVSIQVQPLPSAPQDLLTSRRQLGLKHDRD
jgi:hypothetical protein